MWYVQNKTVIIKRYIVLLMKITSKREMRCFFNEVYFLLKLQMQKAKVKLNQVTIALKS